MPRTYDCLAHTSITSNTAEITFSSIPQTYTDLELVYQIFDTGAYPYFRINGYSATNVYKSTYMGFSANNFIGGLGQNPEYYINSNGGADQNYPMTGVIRFFNYTTTSNKYSIFINGCILNTPSNATETLFSSMLLNTSAITSLVFKDTSDYSTGTTFTLYGIKKA